MNKKFLQFLCTLKRENNLNLVETIERGYMACLEYANQREGKSIILFAEFPEFAKEIINFKLGEQSSREQFLVEFSIKEDWSKDITDMVWKISGGEEDIILAYNKKQEYKRRDVIPITDTHMKEASEFTRKFIAEKRPVLV